MKKIDYNGYDPCLILYLFFLIIIKFKHSLSFLHFEICFGVQALLLFACLAEV